MDQETTKQLLAQIKELNSNLKSISWETKELAKSINVSTDRLMNALGRLIDSNK